VPIVFSEKGMLESLWTDYKNEYLEKDTGRALDKQKENITTSEGQSYTMLRAVWMDDKETFDKAYKWTKNNLGRREDHLFAWLFGKKSDGTYGVLVSQGGYNSASDADSDIALSLIFAYNRWNDKKYLDEAKLIINDIWTYDVVTIKGKPYLTSNNIERFSPNPIINPSYLSPYAYRIFSKIDTRHNWLALAETSYDVLEYTTSSNLNAQLSAHIPPEWVSINKKTGVITATNVKDLGTEYGFNALRTPWRVALDFLWFNEPRARDYLNTLTFLSKEWENKHMLLATYAHDGSVIMNSEAPAMYGGSIGYFVVSDMEYGEQIYEQKLAYLVDSNTKFWKTPLSYYDANWAWFGIALYNDLLPNLTL
jgi:endoglucanase